MRRLTTAPTAPGPAGRRSSFLTLLLLAGYLLLAPSFFFLGPLALLLLVSRPSSKREWIWLLLAIGGVIASALGRSTLLDQTIRGYGAFFAGAFVVTALLGIRSLVTRSLISVSVAALGVMGWYLKLQLRFVDLRAAVVTQTWDAYRRGFPELPATPPAHGVEFVGSSAVSDFARQMADGVLTAGDLAPGWLTLVLLLGGWLAWGWYYRITRRPIGPAPKPFTEFRFNDQLIWLLIAVVGLALLAPQPAIGSLSANLFVVIGGLYAARGIAVVQCALRRVSPWFALVLYLLAIPVLPFALFMIGVSDTWLDLRRRLEPPQGAMP
ncbi:MAG: DUF2232 domain-containing protein [Gemmatimonadota bacterium]